MNKILKYDKECYLILLPIPDHHGQIKMLSYDVSLEAKGLIEEFSDKWIGLWHEILSWPDERVNDYVDYHIHNYVNDYVNDPPYLELVYSFFEVIESVDSLNNRRVIGLILDFTEDMYLIVNIDIKTWKIIDCSVEF